MTQSEAILAHLTRYGFITPMQALNEYGCFRLAARISDLREAGHPIVTEMEDSPLGKRYARYVLVREPEQLAAFG